MNTNEPNKKMENISDIFKGNSEFQKQNEIKNIVIDWKTHSKGIVNIANHLQKDFIVRNSNKHILRLLLLYFTGNPVFETELKDITGIAGSFNKGIMLIGGVGTGKTLIFKIFKEYTKMLHVNSFQVHYANEIIAKVRKDGSEVLNTYGDNVISGRPDPIRCYIDDIAARNENVKDYGNDLEVIKDILDTRYNVSQRYGTLTHISSNKYPSEMKNVYGVRIVDRMKEMFNIIELSGDSFRK